MILPLLACLALIGWDGPRVRPEPLGTFDVRLIPEASGVVQSRRRPDVFWVHNDSGNPSTLFAVGRDGRLLRAFDVAAVNLDWEDVAADDQGRLYLGDLGDNKGVLRLRVIHRLAEPDPEATAAGPLKIEASTYFARTGKDCFDCEGFVVDGDRAILVVKRFDGREADLREVALSPPAPLLNPTTAKPVGVLPSFVEPATGADLSRDGARLAVCGVRVVRVYERPSPPAWDDLRLVAEVFLEGGRQVEGIAWDGDDLILASEGGGLDRLSAKAWRTHAPRAGASRRGGR